MVRILDPQGDVLDREKTEFGEFLSRVPLHPGAVELAQNTAGEARYAPLAPEKEIVGDAERC